MSSPVPPPTAGELVPMLPVSPRGEPLAGPWPRIGARALDLLCMAAIDLLILVAIAGDASDVTNPFHDVDGVRFVAGALVALLVNFGWEAVLTKVRGGTPFKLLFGLRVVRSTDGASVSWTQSSGRWALSVGLLVLPLLSGLLFLTSLVLLFSSPRRQAVWDQVAKTLVVRPIAA